MLTVTTGVVLVTIARLPKADTDLKSVEYLKTVQLLRNRFCRSRIKARTFSGQPPNRFVKIENRKVPNPELFPVFQLPVQDSQTQVR